MRRVVELVGPRGQSATIVGGILGLASDESLLRSAFGNASPKELLLGIPYEDLDAIRATAGKETTHEFESGDLDDLYLKRLAAFGETRTPPPDLYAAFALAEEKKVPVRPIDLADEAYTEAFTRNVGFLEVLRSNRNQKKLPGLLIEAKTPEEFALRWDEELYPTKGLQKLQQLREDELAAAIHKTIADRFLALVALPRFEGVLARLQREGWKLSASSTYRG
jgi:hypothetical protein